MTCNIRYRKSIASMFIIIIIIISFNIIKTIVEATTKGEIQKMLITVHCGILLQNDQERKVRTSNFMGAHKLSWLPNNKICF